MKTILRFEQVNAIFLILFCMFFLVGNSLKGQGFETFDSLRIPGTAYLDSSFRGNNDIKWTYIKARQEGSYAINGRGITLRDVSYESKLFSDSIPNGISSFSLKVRKANTSSGIRQIAIYINGDSVTSSAIFGTIAADTIVHTVSINSINYADKFIFEIKSIGNQPLVLDDIQWLPYPDTITTRQPIVQTGIAEWVTTDTCELSGTILDNGSSSIIEKGILLGTTPTIDFTTGTKLISIIQGNFFGVNFTDFQRNTTYYYQAYAVNATDTGYGQIASFMAPDIIVPDVNIETFELLQASSSTYSNGIFIGNNGIKWNYVNARSNVSDYPIDGKGLIFRYSAESLDDNSRIFSDSIAGGIANFSVKLRKASTGTGVRQVVLYVNNDSIAASQRFGNFTGASDTIYTFSVNGINIAGVFSMEIRQVTGSSSSSRQLTIDDITWSNYSTLSIQTLAAIDSEVGGFITDSGRSAITEKGILLGETPNLSLETNEKITATEFENPFHINIAQQLNNWETDILYYKAYAINQTDTAYGEVMNIQLLRIKEFVAENALSAIIYPNPSTGNFSISVNGHQNVMVKIHNSIGQSIIEKNVASSEKCKISLQQKGTYYIQIEDITTKKYIMKKVIVM